jgi:hypothetical protein
MTLISVALSVGQFKCGVRTQRCNCLISLVGQAGLEPATSTIPGNAGISFRVGRRDAELLAPEFQPMEQGALAHLTPFIAWLRRSDSGGADNGRAEALCSSGAGHAVQEWSRRDLDVQVGLWRLAYMVAKKQGRVFTVVISCVSSR